MRMYCFVIFLFISLYGCGQAEDDKKLKAISPDLAMVKEMNFKGYDTTYTIKGLNELLEKGKPVVIDFWATWCVPCLKEIPHLTELYRRYKSNGLQIIGLTTEDTSKVANEFIFIMM